MSNIVTINDGDLGDLEHGMMFEKDSTGDVYMIFFTDSASGGMYDLRCLTTGKDVGGRCKDIRDIFDANSRIVWKRRREVTIEDCRE